ncbi:MAG: DUF3168 domain-containing protein [Hyphomonadaceae bacterium]
MSGAFDAVEAGLTSALQASAAVRAVLGDPVRLRRPGDPMPAFPFVEIVRHQVSERSGTGTPGEDHRVDLAVTGRDGEDVPVSAAREAVRAAVDDADLPMDGWRSILTLVVFIDVLTTPAGASRTLMSVRVLLEPVSA